MRKNHRTPVRSLWKINGKKTKCAGVMETKTGETKEAEPDSCWEVSAGRWLNDNQNNNALWR